MPDILDDAFWRNEEEALFAIILPLIEDAVLDGVAVGAEQLGDMGMGVDLGAPTAHASRWAREHAGELIRGGRGPQGPRGLNATTRDMVGGAVSNWIETPGATMGDLTQKLQRILGGNEYRAAMVATTEVTRSYSAGSDIARRDAGMPHTVVSPPLHPNCRCRDSMLQLDNGEWVVLWQTNRDEVVCTQQFMTPIGDVGGCRDMHGRVISAGEYLGQRME